MDGDSIPVKGSDGAAQTDPNKLAMLVLSKAIQSQDNPVKLRAYVDSYSKLIGRGGVGLCSPITIGEEMEELDTPARLAKVKKIILNMLKFYHPYMKDSLPAEERAQISRAYRDWHASVEKVMEPIFNGTLPNPDLLSVNEMDSLS